MSDVIKFDEFKNKAKDKEVDRFEEYMYSLYYKMAEGKMSFQELNRELMNYINEHGISMEEFNEIQMRLGERYGFDTSSFKNSFPGSIDSTLNVATTLKGKYGESLDVVTMVKKVIKNEKNSLTLLCDKNEIIIFSEKSIDLEDNELHDFLVSYRRQNKEESLKIRMGDNYSEFQY